MPAPNIYTGGRVITLLTDFGEQDVYVGVMKGVIAGIAPTARTMDICHGVPPQDVAAGAFMLLSAYRYFPDGTIHVCVVDPGVGTQRNIIAVRAAQHTFIGPDNGLLRWAVDDAATLSGDGADAAGTCHIVRIEQPQYRLPVVSATFHGRDIMAPAAAHLANGVPLESLGAPLATLQGQPLPVPIREAQRLRGSVMYIDRFGNCVTNIRLTEQAADFRRVRVSGVDLILRHTYADVAAGEPLSLIGSSGFLEIAVRNGNAQKQLGLDQGSEVRIEP